MRKVLYGTEDVIFYLYGGKQSIRLFKQKVNVLVPRATNGKRPSKRVNQTMPASFTMWR